MINEVTRTNKRLSTLIKISFLSAVAFLLMFVDLPLPIFPAFLKIDLSDLPALLASFSLGPIAGVLVELIKNILIVIIKGSSTAMIGEISNFFIGSIFVFVAGYIYQKRNTRKNAILGLIIGTIFMTILAAILNYFVLLPVYAKAFGMPIEVIVGMGAAINSRITNLTTLILFCIIPFNLLKGIVVSFVTVIIYKKISLILRSQSVDTGKENTIR